MTIETVSRPVGQEAEIKHTKLTSEQLDNLRQKLDDIDLTSFNPGELDRELLDEGIVTGNVTVEHESGEREDDWQVWSVRHKDTLGDPDSAIPGADDHMVLVAQRHEDGTSTEKIVSLAELQEWQNDETGQNPEVGKAKAEDDKNRYEDKELLGRQFAVRRATHTAANQSMRTIKRGLAAIRNGVATPNKLRKQWLKKRAENSLERVQTRIANAKTDRARRFRARKLEKAQTRFTKRKNLLSDHVGEMKKRREAPKKAWENKHSEYIGNLKERRGMALARKDMRKFAKEQEGMGYFERRKFVKEISDTELKQATGAALVAEAGRRAHHKVEKQYDHHDKNMIRAAGRSQKAGEVLHTTQTERLATKASLAAAIEMVERLRQPTAAAASELEQKRLLFAQLDPDDPDYFAAEADFAAAQAKYDMFAKRTRQADAEVKKQEDKLSRLKQQQLQDIDQRRHTTDSAREADAARKYAHAAKEASRALHEQERTVYEVGLDKILKKEGN